VKKDEPTEAQVKRGVSAFFSNGTVEETVRSILIAAMNEPERPRIEITDEMAIRRARIVFPDPPTKEQISLARGWIDYEVNGPVEPEEPLPAVTREMTTAGLMAWGYDLDYLQTRSASRTVELFSEAFIAAYKVMKGMKP
jgi:hypothetical protein